MIIIFISILKIATLSLIKIKKKLNKKIKIIKLKFKTITRILKYL